MGSRVSAESHPHRSTHTREVQCALVAISLYSREKSLICSLVGAFLRLSLGVASFWWVSLSRLCCCKFALFVSKFGKRVELVLFFIYFNLNCAGFHLKAVLTSLNMAFVAISRSRFKQRQIPPFRTLTNVLRFCENF